MNTLKKFLVLGGKPIGSKEIVTRLKELGHYVIVSDCLDPVKSPAKLLADEYWNISTAEVDRLAAEIKKTEVSAFITGVHEFNINRLIDLSEMFGYPCYCNRKAWRFCDNKSDFKNLCKQSGIRVAKVYEYDELHRNPSGFPVIVKPVDGSGSRGFHICRNLNELEEYYPLSRKFSPTGSVLIEEYVPWDAVIIHYTLSGGRCRYSGMSDKKSVRFHSTGASVMGIQTFPSTGESVYLRDLNHHVERMFENAGFTDGPVWIEAFFDGKDTFIFNEMGYRFGGSLTYYPVRYFYGIDQLDMMIAQASGVSQELSPVRQQNLKKYCILPVHIQPGTIKEIIESPELWSDDVYAVVPVHYLGDVIEEWGSAQQVFAYVHILYSNLDELKENVHHFLDNIRVNNERGENMLFTLFDVNSLTL
jgi:carbamoylphosphate synthase large subunit